MENAPRIDRAPTDRTRAEQVALAEYDALLTMLTRLTPQQWRAPTECAPWTVREMVAHIAGAAEEAVRLRVQLRHLRAARRRGGPLVDALNERQIADREGRSPAELLAELNMLATRASAARRRTPGLIRRRPLPPGAGGLPGDTMGYLLDVIYTRDIWMHRVDISRATGCELPMSDAEQDVLNLIMADMARSWDGPPCRLTLTGPADGTWLLGADHDTGAGLDESAPPAIDAVAACRLWSGRSDETGIAADTPATRALAAARILF